MTREFGTCCNRSGRLRVSILDLLLSRTARGRGVPDELCQLVVQRMDATAARRNCFDFRYAQYSQIRLPLMESIQRIMIRTQIFRNRLPSDRTIEHSAE